MKQKAHACAPVHTRRNEIPSLRSHSMLARCQYIASNDQRGRLHAAEAYAEPVLSIEPARHAFVNPLPNQCLAGLTESTRSMLAQSKNSLIARWRHWPLMDIIFSIARAFVWADPAALPHAHSCACFCFAKCLDKGH